MDKKLAGSIYWKNATDFVLESSASHRMEEGRIDVTNKKIAGLRLLNQHIGSSGFQQPEQTVRAFGALQAQDYMQAVWAIGMRTPAAGLTDVERAIAERKILLTWTLRGTIHCVPSEDVKWMLQLCAPRLLRAAKRRLEQLELDDRTLERCRRIIYQSLKGGRSITRPNLLLRLQDEGIITSSQRGYHILWHSAYNGLICFGPQIGKQQSFVLLDEWATDSRELSFDESLAELSLRYFTTHGPATVQDFAWWTGLTLSDARAGLEAVNGILVSEIIDGSEYWMPRTPENRTGSGDSPTVYLLPGFDEYILGYRDRSAVLEPENAPLIVPGNNGVFMPTIVANGQIIGIWKRIIKKKGVELKLSPFRSTEGIIQEQLRHAAERYADFLRLPLTKFDL